MTPRRSPPPLFIAVTALLAACVGNPSETTDTGEVPQCAEGHLPDRGSCVPEACGAGAWGALEVDASTVYVDIATEAGGDGTEERPLTTIQAGLDLAGSRGGGTVAVAAGSYPETLEMTADLAGVHLAGRCKELVILDASVGDDSTPGIDINTENAELTVSGVAVTGSNHVGIFVREGALRLLDTTVRDSAYVGIAATSASLTSSTSVQLQGCTLEDNTAVGLAAADTGTLVTLADTTIQGTLPDASGNLGYAAEVYRGAELRTEGCLLDDNGIVGVLVYDPDSRAELLETTIRGTQPNGSGVYGYGIDVYGGAELTAEGCLLEENRAVGVLAFDPGTEVTLLDTTIRDTLPEASGEYGLGIQVYEGASLRAEGCVLEGNTNLGVGAARSGTELTLVDSIIRGTLPGEGDEQGGIGLQIHDGAVLAAEGCRLEENTNVGIVVFDPDTRVTLLDTVVQGTLPNASAQGGFGIDVYGGAALTAEACELTGNTNVGVVAFDPGTEVVLLDSVVQATLPNASGQGGFGIQVSGGAALSAEGCELSHNQNVGVLAAEAATLSELQDVSITHTTTGFGELGATGIGLIAQGGAAVTASALLAQGNEGPGLSARSGAELVCTGCFLLDNQFAGAVVVDSGTLELDSTTISGTGRSVNLDGGVGIFAAQQWDWGPPSLLVSDSTIADNLLAGIHLLGDGSYTIEGNDISGSTATTHGSGTRCGDGIYAATTAAWDGSTGLLLEANRLSGNQGAGLFLDDGHAEISGNTWGGNTPDLLLQGQACLAPRESYTAVPDSEICPAWDRPTCPLEYVLNMEIADLLDPAER